MLPAVWFPNTNGTSGAYWTSNTDPSGVFDWLLDVRDGSSLAVARQNERGDGYLHPLRAVRGSK